MALLKTAGYAISATQGPFKRIHATRNKVCTFAAPGADKTLPAGTVVAYNSSTNFWTEWATGGTNDTGTPRGIVWPDPIDLKASGEVLGVVMTEGEAHVDDLVSDGGTTAQLKTALATGSPSLRSLGIYIKGLNTIR